MVCITGFKKLYSEGHFGARSEVRSWKTDCMKLLMKYFLPYSSGIISGDLILSLFCGNLDLQLTKELHFLLFDHSKVASLFVKHGGIKRESKINLTCSILYIFLVGSQISQVLQFCLKIIMLWKVWKTKKKLAI